jgi:hypothetical protein
VNLVVLWLALLFAPLAAGLAAEAVHWLRGRAGSWWLDRVIYSAVAVELVLLAAGYTAPWWLQMAFVVVIGAQNAILRRLYRVADEWKLLAHRVVDGAWEVIVAGVVPGPDDHPL